MLQKIGVMASDFNSTINEYEFCSDFIMGIDNTTHHLFFYKKNDNREVSQQVKLTDYKSCKLVSYSHFIKEGNEQYSVTSKLDLCFYPHSKELKEVAVDIYNVEFDRLSLTGELQFGEKWEKLMNEKLKAVKVTKPGTAPFISVPSADKAEVLKPKRAS